MELKNQAGFIKVKPHQKQENKLSYIKKEWRKWCELHHKEEKETIKIAVENTSFTGENGCQVEWTLYLNENSDLLIEQAAGKVQGEGTLKSLKIKLAAGQVTWEDSTMGFTINVAAGQVKMVNASFPAKGESSVSMGTGDVQITSPANTLVTTTVENAMGNENNEFSKELDHHKLKLEVAVGRANHQILK